MNCNNLQKPSLIILKLIRVDDCLEQSDCNPKSTPINHSTNRKKYEIDPKEPPSLKQQLQAEPIKEWGASNAENKANYGGTSAFNLKKPGMQQDGTAVGGTWG